jgi:transposase
MAKEKFLSLTIFLITEDEAFRRSFDFVFLPPYSSCYNPIERLWSIVKHEWGLYLFKNSRHRLREGDTVDVLANLIEEIDKAKVKRLEDSCVVYFV